MTTYTDSLPGYTFQVHKRDGFKCQYCGVDGSQSFDTWLTLSIDHLLPKGHTNRDDQDYMITACQFCNTADNRYFDLAKKRGLKFDGLTRDEMVAQRIPYVKSTRQKYRSFWEENVKGQ